MDDKTLAIDGGARTMTSEAPSSLAPIGDVDPRIGTLLKNTYRLDRRLGEGGMGAVYLAEHVTIKKKVAVKILGQEYAHRAELKERFLREARAAAAISDDHVIEIHDFGDTPDGSAFFVMEYLQGRDLADLIEREAPLPWPRARDIMLQICGALQAAHERGIVHRDMKPANCFRLDRPGPDVIKVLDFGIAKVQNPDEGVGQALTRTGMIFGTPEYMSPEQAQGGKHDHRVDIYAVGVILFQLLTGRTPFVAESFMGLLNQHMYEPPPRPADLAPQAAIPPAAEAVVLKALQKDPDLRFQTMTEMAAALAAVDAGVAPLVVPEVRRAPPPPGTATSFRTQELPAPRRGGLVLVAALAGAVSAGVLAVVLLGQGSEDMPEHPGLSGQLIAASAPPAGPPPPAPLPPPDPPVRPGPVTLRFDTGGIAAQVFDESGVLLGTTADPAGIVLSHGTDERVLKIRAEGHDELALKVVPNEDRGYPAPLQRTPDAKTAPKKGGKTPKGDAKPAPKVDPKPDAKPDPKPEPKPDDGGVSPDLISPPFGKK